MLKSDVIERYKLSDQFVNKFCNKGCSVECGKFLKEELCRMGILQVDGQMSITDIPGVMP